MENRINVENEQLVKDTIPHGSGINGDWYFSYKNKKLYASNTYHTMNEAGYYDGYADFTLVIPLSQPEDFKLHFNGKDAQYLNKKYMLRDYLEDTFYYWLTGR